jgi:hypothetical protein
MNSKTTLLLLLYVILPTLVISRSQTFNKSVLKGKKNERDGHFSVSVLFCETVGVPLGSLVIYPMSASSEKTVNGSILECKDGSITFRTCDDIEPENVNENRKKNAIEKLIRFKKGEKPESVFQSSFPKEFQVFPGSFVHIAEEAYSEHHKLVIRPEDIWAAIQVQFSNYVNKYANELRSNFVSHEGKQELEVTDVEAMSKNVGVMSTFMVEKMKRYLNDESLVEWMLPSFSTTTDNDKIVFSVIAMGSMQNYFGYKMTTRCGLPEVTLLGTVEDWRLIRTRAEKLVEFEIEDKMKKWTDLLLPPPDKLVETADGKPDYYWWNQICHYHGGGSGLSFISGWASAFTVFHTDGRWLGDKFEYRGKKLDWPLIDMNDISPTYTNCSVTVNDNGNEFESKMYAGIMCADVIENNTLVPRLDWVMFEMETQIE